MQSPSSPSEIPNPKSKIAKRRWPWRRAAQIASLVLFCALFFYVAWPYSADFGPELIPQKEWIALELFLWVDPLVGISTAIAARAWNVALIGAAIVLVLSLLLPRAFCGWICPLGTLIDGVDWLGRLLRPKRPGSRLHNPKSKIQNLKSLRYALLIAVLASSLFGVLLSGFVSAIPVLTRGLMFTAARLQLGLMKNWAQLKPEGWTFHVSVGLFAAIFLLTIFGRRFWCRHVCPTGALFSVASLWRLTERKVEATCVQCGRCVEACSFGAIAPDYSTRPLECAFCQTCGEACPTGAIRYRVGQVGNLPEDFRVTLEKQKRQVANLPHSNPPHIISRRGFVLSAAGGAAIAVATRSGLADGFRPRAKLLRPPGSVAEEQFLDLCIRCGECFKVCPGPVLHPAGLEGGFEALWTPVVVPTHAGCHQDCNFCTLVCPTRAIRVLPIEIKRKWHMGLAVIKPELCLPHKGERDCQLCYDECEAAGYHAIEMREMKLDTSKIPEGIFSDEEIERMSKIRAPFIIAEKCVGCGLCEYRCHTALVKQEKILSERAVVTVPENEDR